MTRLHELAERMGVETLYRAGDNVPHVFYIGNHRPDLEIAHDMLAKLPVEDNELLWTLKLTNEESSAEWVWAWWDDKDEEGTGPFIECVCELASRHIGELE